MKKIAISISVALASLLAANAFAQSKGEADPAQSKAIPTNPATPAEKAAAKESRKSEGSKVAKTHKTGDDQPSSTASGKVSKDEKQAAAAKRKAEASAAVKKGQISSGEK